jgi:hypothetical protein
MSTSKVIAALVLAASVGPVAGADIITYRSHGTLLGNNFASGAFSGASAGTPVTVWVTVDTSVAPAFSGSGVNSWDGVAGVVTGLKARVGGAVSEPAPGSADHVRVVDDGLLSGGPNHYDQFWLEVTAGAPSPDFSRAIVILSSIAGGPTAPSSRTGPAFPTDSSQVVVDSFTNEKAIYLRGSAPGEILSATLEHVEVIPSPGAGALLVGASLLGLRRRRCVPG